MVQFGGAALYNGQEAPKLNVIIKLGGLTVHAVLNWLLGEINR